MKGTLRAALSVCVLEGWIPCPLLHAQLDQFISLFCRARGERNGRFKGEKRMSHEDVERFKTSTGKETIDNKELEAELRSRAKDNRITCPEMFAIAEKLGLPRKEVGQAATDLMIKICKCQLGCF